MQRYLIFYICLCSSQITKLSLTSNFRYTLVISWLYLGYRLVSPTAILLIYLYSLLFLGRRYYRRNGGLVCNGVTV